MDAVAGAEAAQRAVGVVTEVGVDGDVDVVESVAAGEHDHVAAGGGQVEGFADEGVVDGEAGGVVDGELAEEDVVATLPWGTSVMTCVPSLSASVPWPPQACSP